MSFTEEETEEMTAIFEGTGFKPKTGSKEEMEQSMVDYLSKAGKLPSKSEQGQTTKQILQQPPRVSNFSGDTSKGDAAFDLWEYEVKCLIKEGVHTNDSIHQAVRKSLKGEAGRMAMRLGPNATLDDIITKLQGVFGLVETSETLLTDFYAARQRDDESVVSWGCRLEDLLDRAKQQGVVSQDSMNDMLRTKFWGGLTRKLKDASRYKFDTIRDFDVLRVELRTIEQDYKEETTSPGKDSGAQKTQSKMATVGGGNKSEVQELRQAVSDLAETVKSLRQQMHTQTGQQGQNVSPNATAQNSGNVQGNVQGNPAPSNPSSGARSVPTCNYCREQGHLKWNCPVKANMQCFKCRQIGHMARDCTVRMDHSRNYLNGQMPESGDRLSASGQGVPR